MKNSPHNDLNKYLPDSKESEEKRKESLYSKFSTIEQISKSLEIEKKNFDREFHEFNEKVNSCNKHLKMAQASNKELLEKIEDFNRSLESVFHSNNSNFEEEFPKIPLHDIYYDLKINNMYENPAEKQELHYLENEIEKTEKECAKLFLNENDKFQDFSLDLKAEFDKIENNFYISENDEDKKSAETQLITQEKALKERLKSWEKSLSERFSDKMLKLIEKVENSM